MWNARGDQQPRAAIRGAREGLGELGIFLGVARLIVEHQAIGRDPECHKEALGRDGLGLLLHRQRGGTCGDHDLGLGVGERQPEGFDEAVA